MIVILQKRITESFIHHDISKNWKFSIAKLWKFVVSVKKWCLVKQFLIPLRRLHWYHWFYPAGLGFRFIRIMRTLKYIILSRYKIISANAKRMYCNFESMLEFMIWKLAEAKSSLVENLMPIGLWQLLFPTDRINF